MNILEKKILILMKEFCPTKDLTKNIELFKIYSLLENKNIVLHLHKKNINGEISKYKWVKSYKCFYSNFKSFIYSQHFIY